MDSICSIFDKGARIGNICYSVFELNFIMKISISKEGSVNEQELLDASTTTQQYVRTAVHAVLEELGVKVTEEWEMDDDSIEITI